MVDTAFGVPADERDRFTTLSRRDGGGALQVSDEPEARSPSRLRSPPVQVAW